MIFEEGKSNADLVAGKLFPEGNYTVAIVDKKADYKQEGKNDYYSYYLSVTFLVLGNGNIEQIEGMEDWRERAFFGIVKKDGNMNGYAYKVDNLIKGAGLNSDDFKISDPDGFIEALSEKFPLNRFGIECAYLKIGVKHGTWSGQTKPEFEPGSKPLSKEEIAKCDSLYAIMSGEAKRADVEVASEAEDDIPF